MSKLEESVCTGIDGPPTWAKVLLLPVTIPLMLAALIYMVVCEFAEGTWMRMVLMARREW